MTLAEMTDLISEEMGLYDDTSLDLIGKFLNKEYVSLWDRYPWQDAHARGVVGVDAGTGIVAYPANLGRIISIRATYAVDVAAPPEIPEEPEIPANPLEPPVLGLNSRFLDPVDTKFLTEIDPGIFEEHGNAKYYEDFSFPSYRIRLFPIPVRGTTLYFYGKRICPGLTFPTAVSALRGIDSVLMAYAMADMLQRQRQYGKADIKRKEAQELEQAALALEQQQTNQPRRIKTTTVAGNSLAEMTDAVSAICGLWTPEYRIIINEFLRRNYQTLYDTFLWPESLVVVRVPYVTEQVVMPMYIDKVIGVRGTTDMRMFPADAGLFLDITPTIFDEIGDPVGYVTLTPVAVSTLPATTTQLRLASTEAGDNTLIAIRGEVLSAGQELAEQVRLNGTSPVWSRYSYDIPLTIAKDITWGDVTVNASNDNRSLAVIPSGARELKHQRLWFLPAPNSDNLPDSGVFTCLVLGKRAIRPLRTDQDTPIITGVQQVLIAAAAGDLFRKLEKHDLANAMLQKASGSTDVLKAKNMDQAASSPRFVPSVEPRTYVAGCW